MVDDELLEKVLQSASARFMRTGSIGYALLELAQSGFESPMVWAWQLDIDASCRAPGVEARIEEIYADLELARSSGSAELSSGPFPDEKVIEITHKILGLNEAWGELSPECFNSLSTYVAEQAAELWERNDFWIPWETAKADLEEAVAKHKELHPETQQ